MMMVPKTPKSHGGTPHKKSLAGYLPKIDPDMWAEKIGLNEEQLNELEELIAEAALDNMLVNELMARMVLLVPYQKDVATVFGVTPTIVSKRLRGLIGVMDRVHVDKLAIVGQTAYLEREEKRFPYTEKLRALLNLYGVHGTVVNRVILIYCSNVDYYDKEEGFYRLLRNLNFGRRRAAMLTREFFDLAVMPNVREPREPRETKA